MPKFAASIADPLRSIHEPDIPCALELCSAKGLAFQTMETSFFLNRETPISSRLSGMAIWRKSLFAWMSLSAESAMEFFKIPPKRVIEAKSPCRA